MRKAFSFLLMSSFWCSSIIVLEKRTQGTEMLQLVQGDITTLSVDVIVNAANNELNGGGGVDGAIHRAAGPELLARCLELGRCETGKAKLTDGFELKAKHVIHTVGPVWFGGSCGEPELLRSCYVESFQIFSQLALQSIAFPAISTGVYGYPFEAATQIAFAEARAFLRRGNDGKGVVFVYFSDSDYQTAKGLYGELVQEYPTQS